METLKQILIKSIQKNGNQPLTLQHLVNMINLAQRIDENRANEIEKKLDEAYMQIYADQCCDRS